MMGEVVRLRRAELSDAPQILIWESTAEARSVTCSDQIPTLEFIGHHILSSNNLVEDSQIRFIIERSDSVPIGTLDLYNYNPTRKCAEVGIFICADMRRQGYGAETLLKAAEWARDEGLEYLTAEIQTTNNASRALFAAAGFELAESTCLQSIISATLPLK